MDPGKRVADMSGSGSESNDDTPANVDASRFDDESERGGRHPGFGAAGIACLGIIVLGTWFSVLFSMALTREYGVDTQGIGLDDVVGSVILSLPGFGLAILGLWFLRRSGHDRVAAWACLLAAAAIVVLGVAGVVMALVEFANTEGTAPVLASRAGGVFGLAIAVYLARAGVGLLRS